MKKEKRKMLSLWKNRSLEKAEFETVVAETIHGLKDPYNKHHIEEKSFFTNSKPRKKVGKNMQYGLATNSRV